ncbi:phage major capsid protein, HK97 family [Arachidicoccus rhizosphaerae]|uniref:Phage major capsid protein, HK97 family n=1 Tax=Arachidicoccus rhizosphaerae TaxID=551991 RepID=A0A1H4CF80_9BACT|nr:phage major capsid protein [Arachidicoccus rhizosphaerae]SEA59004.1 phage major capsid protein, HK97 family [Arachidicoccus rhizosphaerae]
MAEETMSTAEVTEALKDLRTDLSKQITERTKAVENGATKEELKAYDERIKVLESVGEELKEAKEEIRALQLEAREKSAEKEKGLTLRGQIMKALTTGEEEIKSIANAKSGRVELKKAASIITTGNVGTGVILGMRESGINAAPFRQRFITDLIRTQNGGVGSDPLTWVEKKPKEGGPASVSESNTKPNMDWTYNEGKTTAETLAVYAAITRQQARNMQVLGETVAEELIPNLYDEMDYQVLLGDGAANAAGIGNNLKGIVQYCQAFTGAGLAGKVQAANQMDVLRAAILQARVGNKAATGYGRRTGYIPNAILVSPTVNALLDTYKNANDTYILPPFTTADGSKIKGIRVIENDFVADDQFIVGDFSKGLLNFVEGLSLQVGWVNDQMIKNQLTVLAELVASFRIKYHDQWAFVKGTFATATPLIQKAEAEA